MKCPRCQHERPRADGHLFALHPDDDPGWADAETLAVLGALVESVAASRLLVIVSYRPEHRHEWSGGASLCALRVALSTGYGKVLMLRPPEKEGAPQEGTMAPPPEWLVE